MADTPILLGIDFGTGGCKVTAVTPDGGNAGEASVEYATYHDFPGWSEQNAADWYDALCKALRKLSAKGVDLKRTAALALDGSTHNAVLLDAQMKPVRRTIMWTDQRSTAECAMLREKLEKQIFDTTFQMPSPTWTLPQLLWLRNHEVQVLDRTKHILFVKDYVRYQLTGVAVTDFIEAQGTLFFDMKKNAWATELFALTGLNADVLPELVRPSDRVGSVTASAAKETGLPEGTPVICGTSDSAAEDYGAGAVEPGDCIVKLATAGNVNVMTDAAHPHPRTLTYSHVIPGMYYSVSATNAAALCQRWFRDVFCQFEIEQAEKQSANAYELLDSLAEKSPVGANGICFQPYLQGERSPYWDAKLRAGFTGVSIASTKGDFMRALQEGVAFSLLDCFGLIEEMKLPVNRLILIGGGARSRVWSRIVCDVFRLPVQIPSPADASFGTALIAGTGIGMFPSCREAVKQCLKSAKSLVPNEENAAKYRELFRVYRQYHDALAPIYSKIN